MNRRVFLSAIGATTTVVFAGCLDVITGESPLELAASPAIVAQSALDETGYVFDEQEEIVLDRELEAAGQSRQVVVTNQQTEYQKSISLGPLGEQPAAVFTVLTTPQVNVLNREFNPIAGMSTEELAEMVQDQYDEIQSINHVDDEEITINEQSTRQSRFTAKGRLAGEVIDVFVHISEPVELGDDLVITVGGYPELTPNERDNIRQLMEGVIPG